jgi:hypothetical protein
MKRTPRRLIGMLIALAALMVVPASAQALTLSGLVASPASTQAGAHSNFHLHMDFAGGQVKDLTIGLPPGMVGDPNATPLCTVGQLNADACPTNTRVGSVVANATVTVAVLPVTLNVSGDLYNVTPQPGEPARFGIVLRPIKGDLCALLPAELCALVPNILPPVILQSAVQLRPDFGLNTVINNIPNSTSGLPTTINSQDITLFGTAPGTGKAFMRNPTSCKQQTTNFTAVPYSGGSDTGQASFTTTNCGALDFSPTFSAEVGGPGQTGPNRVPTTANTSIDQDNGEAGLQTAVVAVPSNDLVPNANLLGFACAPADFQAGTCLGNSVVGTAVAGSPLLSQPLAGNVMLVSNGTPVPDIGLDLKGQLHLLLTGSLTLSEVVTFGGLPDIPISHFALTFTPNPGLLMANRDLCAPPPPLFHADFTGYNGATTSVDSAAVVDGCGAGSGNVGGKCKKAKKKRHHRAAEAKKHKKRSCKKKRHKKKR